MNIQPEYVEMEEILRHVRSASIQCLRDMVTSGTARYHKTINSVSFFFFWIWLHANVAISFY